MEIRRITPDETIAVRWPVLRDGFPRETAVFAGDELSSTMHFGAYEDETLVGVASVYAAPWPLAPTEPAWQLRGMATLPAAQGRGYGKSLLQHCELAVREAGGSLLWCNARVGAVPFYERHGWARVGDESEIPTVGPHFRMRRQLD